MTAEVVSYMLSNEDTRQRLQAQLVLQCAPFLKGLQTACVVSFEAEFYKQMNRILEGTGISDHLLTVREKRCLIFFYRAEEFSVYLRRKEVAAFLKKYGYGGSDHPEEILRKLSRRIACYREGGQSFPHEIGALLGYPIPDVEAFIRNAGKNYLLAGYWKVYHDPLKAQITFCAYDQARKSAVNEFLTGKSIRCMTAGRNGA